ncbi:uncharacterized protein EV422DRAFT_563322 [Fimicolochytrium jonesii]|uniref:uncharacterized protein n=1 Tax=Fimicolochytrium jonesii TaxID=1396493 RepID=UPI0022FDC924|nr:uncharacterized protein EV422DRAFT_563322 [Fimicolochytrium jonesii]KAI8827237.1 hypothetical protein EV422DRAFT_563322 [Fimicolochytrium jonesii]
MAEVVISFLTLARHLHHPIILRLNQADSLHGYLLNVDPETLTLILAQVKEKVEDSDHADHQLGGVGMDLGELEDGGRGGQELGFVEQEDERISGSTGQAENSGNHHSNFAEDDYSLIIVMRHAVVGVEADQYADRGPTPLTELQVTKLLSQVSASPTNTDTDIETARRSLVAHLHRNNIHAGDQADPNVISILRGAVKIHPPYSAACVDVVGGDEMVGGQVRKVVAEWWRDGVGKSGPIILS